MSILRSRSSREKKNNKPADEVKVKNLPFPYFHLSVAFIFTLLIFVGIVLVFGKLTGFANEAEVSRGQLMALREQEATLLKLSQDFQRLGTEIAIIDQALPDEERIVDFVKSFKEISQDVSVEVFNFETDQPAGVAEENLFIDFSVELKGSFEALRTFLEKLVRLPYLVSLRLVDIFGVDQEEAQMVLKVRIFVDSPFFWGE